MADFYALNIHGFMVPKMKQSREGVDHRAWPQVDSTPNIKSSEGRQRVHGDGEPWSWEGRGRFFWGPYGSSIGC